MNTTTEAIDIKTATKEQLKAYVAKLEAQKAELKTAIKEKKSQQLRSEHCKAENNFHVAVANFKDIIINNLDDYKEYIVKNDENEIVVNNDFRTKLIAELRTAFTQFKAKKTQ